MLKKVIFCSLFAIFASADCQSDVLGATKDAKFPILNGAVSLENISCDGETLQINFTIPNNPNFRKEALRDEFEREFFEGWRQKYCLWKKSDDLLDVFKDREWLVEVRTKDGSRTWWRSFSKKSCENL